MGRCSRLGAKAIRNPADLRFAELCKLAECYGWSLRRMKGSHWLFSKAGATELMNFQNSSGMAKPYQVRQLLKAIEAVEYESEEPTL